MCFDTGCVSWETRIRSGDECGYVVTAPAWTKEELDAMIGPEFPKPDLWKPDKVGKEQDPESYPVYYPDKMKIFKKLICFSLVI